MSLRTTLARLGGGSKRCVVGARRRLGRALLRDELAAMEHAETTALERAAGRARRAEARAQTARLESAEARAAYLELSASVSNDLVEPTAARREGDRPPSFRYKIGEQRRIALEMENTHGVREPVMRLDGKSEGRAFAADLGVPIPELFLGPTPLNEVDFNQFPDRFVVKPADSHSSRGVYPLVRTESGSYASLLDRGAVMSELEIREQIAASVARGLFEDLVLVEELLAEEGPNGSIAPIDWRLFCFHGRVGLIQARDPHGYRSVRHHFFRFFDEEWRDQGVVRLDVRHDPAIEIPDQADNLVRAASRISEAIPRAMVRVDLYAMRDAVYFGEITPTPGGEFSLTPTQDRRLGAMWETAESELTASAIRVGAFDIVPDGAIR